MEMDQTKEFLLEEMREGIDKVISGELDMYENDLLAPAYAFEYFEQLDKTVDRTPDDMHNGWELDCWYKIEFKRRIFTLQGSGYNGGLKVYEEED